jgi:hypothetical protein
MIPALPSGCTCMRICHESDSSYTTVWFDQYFFGFDSENAMARWVALTSDCVTLCGPRPMLVQSMMCTVFYFGFRL